VGGELRLHALRDFVYGLLFLSLPFVPWHGWLAVLLGLLILLEISITIWDFNIEVIERAPLGGVANRERGLHLVMAVVYGYFLAQLIPHMIKWFSEPTGFAMQAGIPRMDSMDRDFSSFFWHSRSTRIQGLEIFPEGFVWTSELIRLGMDALEPNSKSNNCRKSI
jgi:hypothetical protein